MSRSEVRCEFCDVPFDSTQGLISHSVQCSERPEDATFDCKHCGNKYVTSQALDQHLEGCGPTDSEFVYECDECGGKFANPSELIEHKQSDPGSHSNGRPMTEWEAVIQIKNATGYVNYYTSEDGYGFISTADLAELEDSANEEWEDVFFHISDYPAPKAEEDELLQFDIIETERGYKAINLHRISREVDEWDDSLASLRPRWGQDT